MLIELNFIVAPDKVEYKLAVRVSKSITENIVVNETEVIM